MPKIKMLRTPANRPDRLEGEVYDVKAKEAAEWFALGLAVDPTKPLPTPNAAAADDDEDEGDGLDDKPVAELLKIAAAEGNTPQSRTKPEMLAEIRAARVAKAAKTAK